MVTVRTPARSLLAVALALGGFLVACGDDGPTPQVAVSEAGAEGRAVADEFSCATCHSVNGNRGVGPTWEGLAGSEVELDDGTTVTADAAYLARAIIDPRAEVVAGYPNSMPVYGDRLTSAQVDALVAYLQDLGGTPPPPPD